MSLVVSDGLVNSSPSNLTVTAVSEASRATQALVDAVAAVNGLAAAAFKNPNMRNALTNKIQAVLADIEAGRYADALGKLQHDVLKKTDGCAIAGAPDRNDWIEDCASQAPLHGLIAEAIVLLQELVG